MPSAAEHTRSGDLGPPSDGTPGLSASYTAALGRSPTKPGLIHTVLPLLALTPFAAAAWFVIRFDPTDRVPDPTGPCLYHGLTGLNGPTCGGTRMFYHLIHGDLINAARHHLPALLAVPFLGYMWVGWMLSRFGLRLPRLRLSRSFLIGYGVFFFVFTTVLRNIDWGPFAWFDIPNLDMAR